MWSESAVGMTSKICPWNKVSWPSRVLVNEGHSRSRPRRTRERKCKSVRGWIVDAKLSALKLVTVGETKERKKILDWQIALCSAVGAHKNQQSLKAFQSLYRWCPPARGQKALKEGKKQDQSRQDAAACYNTLRKMKRLWNMLNFWSSEWRKPKKTPVMGCQETEAVLPESFCFWIQ